MRHCKNSVHCQESYKIQYIKTFIGTSLWGHAMAATKLLDCFRTTDSVIIECMVHPGLYQNQESIESIDFSEEGRFIEFQQLMLLEDYKLEFKFISFENIDINTFNNIYM